jgi:transposase
MEQHYIGVDLHKAFFQACAVQMSGERVWERRFPRSAEGLAMFRDRCDTTTRVAVEATGPTWSFVDAIQPTGATLCVVDPRKTRLKAGFAAKTDRLDARRLADALRRESIVSVYVPPPAIRELREVCRGRHQLVRMRSRLVQMIRALLLRSGVEDAPVSRLYGVRGAAWLAHVHLAPEAERTMRRLERLLRVVHGEIVEAESVVATHAAADPIARALDTLVGIGPVRALTLRAEIGDIARFRHGGRELASYAGLVTRVDRSADHGHYGRITREGSPWLRYVLVEAAVNAMKRSDAIGQWARRLARRKGAGIARVALARVLCGEIVRVWPRSV